MRKRGRSRGLKKTGPTIDVGTEAGQATPMLTSLLPTTATRTDNDSQIPPVPPTCTASRMFALPPPSFSGTPSEDVMRIVEHAENFFVENGVPEIYKTRVASAWISGAAAARLQQTMNCDIAWSDLKILMKAAFASITIRLDESAALWGEKQGTTAPYHFVQRKGELVRKWFPDVDETMQLALVRHLACPMLKRALETATTFQQMCEQSICLPLPAEVTVTPRQLNTPSSPWRPERPPAGGANTIPVCHYCPDQVRHWHKDCERAKQGNASMNDRPGPRS